MNQNTIYPNCIVKEIKAMTEPNIKESNESSKSLLNWLDALKPGKMEEIAVLGFFTLFFVLAAIAEFTS
jgi:cytochrome c1